MKFKQRRHKLKAARREQKEKKGKAPEIKMVKKPDGSLCTVVRYYPHREKDK